MTGRSRQPGELLARGRTADVFALNGGLVLRRYRGSGADAEHEARVMLLARSHGVPVPEVHDASGRDLVMERVTGPTMLHELLGRPWTVRRRARLLAELHRRIHAVPAPPWLRRPFGEGVSLLHLDLHPDNVILSPAGPVVIDWTNASGGPADADAALTWLLIATSSEPVPAPLRPLVGELARSFNRTFRAEFEEGAIEDQLRAVARWRLRDPNVLPRERARIHRFLDRVEG